jgi:hypothetical protein
MMEEAQNEIIDQAILEDEFTSRNEYRINRWIQRFIRWLHHPPRFPVIVLWPFYTIAFAELVIRLLGQGSEYWVDPTITKVKSLLYMPLSWGPVVVILSYLAYFLIITFLFSLFNRKVSFLFYLMLFLYHGFHFSELFSCKVPLFISFIDKTYCSQHELIGTLFVGIMFAISVGVAYQMGVFNHTAVQEQEENEEDTPSHSKFGKVVAFFSGGVVLAFLTLIIITAFPKKANWQLLETAHAPDPRSRYSLAYDSDRAKAVLFGGGTAWTESHGWYESNDTWEWDGEDWEQKFPENSPSARRDGLMVYDEYRDVTVLFGGVYTAGDQEEFFLNDVWEWDGENWTNIEAAYAPQARASGVIYFDPELNEVIIHGGNLMNEWSEYDFPEDTWAWNGSEWREVYTEGRHTSSGEAYVYDPVEGYPMTIGEISIDIFKDNRWFEKTYVDGPEKRWSGGMTYDLKNEAIILYGGRTDDVQYVDTWMLKGEEWTQIFTKDHPPYRKGYYIFYDPNRESVILFGGIDDLTVLNDTWELVLP